MENQEMVTKKSWNEFRNTGLFLFINSILHAFGWAIVVYLNDAGEVTGSYPARVKFRGFDEASTEEAHKKIGKYLAENAEELRKETEL